MMQETFEPADDYRDPHGYAVVANRVAWSVVILSVAAVFLVGFIVGAVVTR